jgi:hypothetical protein
MLHNSILDSELPRNSADPRTILVLQKEQQLEMKIYLPSSQPVTLHTDLLSNM